MTSTPNQVTTTASAAAGKQQRPRVAFAMASNHLRDSLFPEASLKRLRLVADIEDGGVLTEFESPASQDVLGRVDVLVTGWGSPRIDGPALDAAPGLKLISHAAGTVKHHVDPMCWGRGITVTTAAEANSHPVAEYTLGFILLAGKRTFAAAQALRQEQAGYDTFGGLLNGPANVGNNGGVVGIVGASRVGRRVLSLLRPFNMTVLLADPTLTSAEAAALGAELVPLEELMARSYVVSLHAPELASTRGMIGAAQFAAMPDGATFINTARGSLVDHDALRTEAGTGRIHAVLDVTFPEPLPDGDPLYSMPNVILTPHIAGSMGNELALMGDAVIQEVERFAAGLPSRYGVSLRELDLMA